jgi:hypothetical protein
MCHTYRVCLGPWRGHTVCNKFDGEKLLGALWAENSSKLTEMISQRRRFYFTRYTAHQSNKEACQHLLAKIRALNSVYGNSLIPCVIKLIKFHSKLSWSYVTRYFIVNGNLYTDLFESVQAYCLVRVEELNNILLAATNFVMQGVEVAPSVFNRHKEAIEAEIKDIDGSFAKIRNIIEDMIKSGVILDVIVDRSGIGEGGEQMLKERFVPFTNEHSTKEVKDLGSSWKCLLCDNVNDKGSNVCTVCFQIKVIGASGANISTLESSLREKAEKESLELKRRAELGALSLKQKQGTHENTYNMYIHIIYIYKYTYIYSIAPSV